MVVEPAVLDRDPCAVEADDIAKLDVVATMTGGRIAAARDDVLPGGWPQDGGLLMAA